MKIRMFLGLFIGVAVLFVQSCSMEEQSEGCNIVNYVGNKLTPSRISSCLIDYISENQNVTRAVNDSTKVINKWNITEAV